MTFYPDLLLGSKQSKKSGGAAQEIVLISEKELYSNSRELEQKLIQAAGQGFFYVKIPTKLQDRAKDVIANDAETPVMPIMPDGEIQMKYPSYKKYLEDLVAGIKDQHIEIPKLDDNN